LENAIVVRRLLILCSLGALAAGLSGCAAGGNAEAGCVQPPLQTYPTPQMVYPQPGTTLSATGPQFVYVAYPASPPLMKVGGVFTLTPSTPAGAAGVGVPMKSVSTLPAGSATPQSGYTTFFYGSVGSLAPKTTYALTYTIDYTLGCLAGGTSKTVTVASFNTP
jgi:hypothetical protein